MSGDNARTASIGTSDRHPTRIRALVADDNELIRQIIGITLGDEAFDLAFAADGEEALVTIRTTRPRVAIVDAALPRVSGFEVCRRVKEDATLAATRVILLISAARPNEPSNARVAGADDVCVKPFSPIILMEKIKEVLGGR